MLKYLVGVDEAGRGPLAGPVAVASFAISTQLQGLALEFFPKGKVKDSKKLSPENREKIFKLLQIAKSKSKVNFAVSFSSASLIDNRGLSFAIKKSLALSLKKMDVNPGSSKVLLDGGLKAPSEYLSQKTIIKGDEKEAVIALASIVAKVSRDQRMKSFSLKYPLYGFDVHKGYGTKSHYSKIKKHGLCPIHRRSFTKNLPK